MSSESGKGRDIYGWCCTEGAFKLKPEVDPGRCPGGYQSELAEDEPEPGIFRETSIKKTAAEPVYSLFKS